MAIGQEEVYTTTAQHFESAMIHKEIQCSFAWRSIDIHWPNKCEHFEHIEYNCWMEVAKMFLCFIDLCLSVHFGDVRFGDLDLGNLDLGLLDLGNLDLGLLDLGDLDLGLLDLWGLDLGDLVDNCPLLLKGGICTVFFCTNLPSTFFMRTNSPPSGLTTMDSKTCVDCTGDRMPRRYPLSMDLRCTSDGFDEHVCALLVLAMT